MEPTGTNAQLPLDVVWTMVVGCVVTLVAFDVADDVEAFEFDAVVDAFVDAGVATEFALACATVPAIAKNDAMLSPPSSQRLLAAA